jgi:hypothetical protein
MGQFTDCFWRQRNGLCNLRRRDTFRQLPQSQGAQNDAHLLNATPEHSSNFSQILRAYPEFVDTRLSSILRG